MRFLHFDGGLFLLNLFSPNPPHYFLLEPQGLLQNFGMVERLSNLLKFMREIPRLDIFEFSDRF